MVAMLAMLAMDVGYPKEALKDRIDFSK